jgi:hypothetical protein
LTKTRDEGPEPAERDLSSIDFGLSVPTPKGQKNFEVEVEIMEARPHDCVLPLRLRFADPWIKEEVIRDVLRVAVNPLWPLAARIATLVAP